jgi:hypothetical protein
MRNPAEVIFEALNTLYGVRNFIGHDANEYGLIRIMIRVFEAKCVLYELIVEQKILIIVVALVQVKGNPHVLSEHDPNLKPRRCNVCEIGSDKFRVSIYARLIDVLPLKFANQSQFALYLIQLIANCLPLASRKQYATEEVRIVSPLPVGLVGIDYVMLIPHEAENG